MLYFPFSDGPPGLSNTAAPFIVGADGPDPVLFTTLDNLIAAKRLPVMIAISISNGGGDAQGSERGLEYDTMSGRYADFVEHEVLPAVESRLHIRLTRNPDGRATMGGSSGGSCAFIMAWYHPERYHRVLRTPAPTSISSGRTTQRLLMERGGFTSGSFQPLTQAAAHLA